MTNKKTLILNILIVNLLGAITIFSFEPLKNYLCNTEDYWFDLKEYLVLIGLPAGAAFLGGFFLLIVISLFSEKIAEILTRIEFFLIIGFYIQGNLIPSTIGALDGTPVDWTKANIDMILSDVLWIMLIVACILTCVKIKRDKHIKISNTISISLLLLELVTIVSLLIPVLTAENEDREYFMSDACEMELSGEQNLIILVLDCFDSTYFKEALSDDLKMELEGFTYYPDTTSMYGHTLCSLSQILTGVPYTNQSTYEDYEKEAFEDSALLKKFNKAGWNWGLYSEYVFPVTDTLDKAVNLMDSGYSISSYRSFYEIIYRIVGYSVAPYHLKQLLWFYPQMSDIKDTPASEEYGVYTGNNEEFFNELDTMNSAGEEATFRFYHIEGMHTPYMTDENVTTSKEEVSFEDTREACYRIIDKFIEQLKDSGIYDTTAIIIMADHGGLDRVDGMKQNPLFMVKGFNERHDFEISDTPFSFENIMTVYENMLAGKIGDDIIENGKSDGSRIFYEYGYDTMDQMIKHEIKGKAWEAEFD